MSIPQHFQFQMQPSQPFMGDAMLAYAGHSYNNSNNYRNSNNITNAERRNGGYTNAPNGRIVENNDAAKGDFFTSVETNNPTQNVAQIPQRQRSLSVGSVGSFSMDGEENDMNFSDNNNVKSDSATTNSRLDQNAVTQQKAPPPVNNNNSSTSKSAIQTDVPENNPIQPQQPKEEEEEAPSPPSTNDGMTQPAKANGVSNDNNDQLTQYETSLRALGTAPKTEGATTTTTRTKQADTNAESQEKRIPQHQQAANGKVIELLDDDAENDVRAPAKQNNPQSAGVKRERPAGTIVPGSSLHGYQAAPNVGYNNSARPPHVNPMMMPRPFGESSEPEYFEAPPHYTPTWRDPLPIHQPRQNPAKSFELSLLNLSEFTMTGLPVSFDGRPSSCKGFRMIIKKVSKGHGEAVFERDNPKNKNGTSSSSSALNEQYSSHGETVNPDGGKWRIPLVRLIER